MNALRKRVLLKSPVRKIRTPGSVRGLLGNWQSYRNSEILQNEPPEGFEPGNTRL
jgi:hypothetical protein